MIRAGLVTAVAAGVDGGLVDPHIAYVTGDEAFRTPFARGYRVLETLPYREKPLKAALRERGHRPPDHQEARRRRRPRPAPQAAGAARGRGRRPWCSPASRARDRAAGRALLRFSMPRRGSPAHLDRQPPGRCCATLQHRDQSTHRAGRVAVRRDPDRRVGAPRGRTACRPRRPRRRRRGRRRSRRTRSACPAPAAPPPGPARSPAGRHDGAPGRASGCAAPGVSAAAPPGRAAVAGPGQQDLQAGGLGGGGERGHRVVVTGGRDGRLGQPPATGSGDDRDRGRGQGAGGRGAGAGRAAARARCVSGSLASSRAICRAAACSRRRAGEAPRRTADDDAAPGGGRVRRHQQHVVAGAERPRPASARRRRAPRRTPAIVQRVGDHEPVEAELAPAARR